MLGKYEQETYVLYIYETHRRRCHFWVVAVLSLLSTNKISTLSTEARDFHIRGVVRLPVAIVKMWAVFILIVPP